MSGMKLLILSLTSTAPVTFENESVILAHVDTWCDL